MMPKIQCYAAFFCVAVAAFSCQSDQKNPAADVLPKIDTIRVTAVPKEGAVNYIVTTGVVTWAGKKFVGDGHQGTIAVEKGALTVNQNRLINGVITLDMASIAVSDIEDAGERRDLESHLKDADFFEAEKYPKAEFVIREVLPSNAPTYNWLIVGDLTMKGKTNSVNIPVKMTFEGQKLRAESPTFPIIRTQWGVNFRAGLLGTPKDKLIDDVVLLSLTLEARQE
jgi:polyisoprenoid-binding protein YceI